METIRNRRASKAQWAMQNPILASGEVGFEIGSESDTSLDKFKMGNGKSRWNDLKYFVNETAVGSGGGGGRAREIAYVQVASIFTTTQVGVWENWSGLSLTLPATDQVTYLDLSSTTSEMVGADGVSQIQIVDQTNASLALQSTQHHSWINSMWPVPALRARLPSHPFETTVRVQVKISWNSDANIDAVYNSEQGSVLFTAT